MIELAIFDMDHTVIDTDCDVSWKYYLVDRGLAPAEHCRMADRFFDLYHQGKIPVVEFIKFQLNEFVDHTEAEMRVTADNHFNDRVRQFVYPAARELIHRFNAAGVPTVMLTGTNRIIAEPVAAYLGIDILLATEPEIIAGHFTGQISGPFLMKEDKLAQASQLSSAKHISLDKIAFYADSINDVALLEKVGQPVVINPQAELRSIARANNWQIESWVFDGKPLALKS